MQDERDRHAPREFARSRSQVEPHAPAAVEVHLADVDGQGVDAGASTNRLALGRVGQSQIVGDRRMIAADASDSGVALALDCDARADGRGAVDHGATPRRLLARCPTSRRVYMTSLKPSSIASSTQLEVRRLVEEQAGGYGKPPPTAAPSRRRRRADRGPAPPGAGGKCR